MTHNSRKDPVNEDDDGAEGDAIPQPEAGETVGTELPPATEPSSGEADLLRQEVERLQAKLAAQADQALRAQAELENFRRRAVRDIENAHKYALERFIADLLPVIDSIEAGVSAAASQADIESLREGLDLTRKKFLDSLEKFGVVTLNPLGEKFNPERHEAVSAQAIEGAEPGTVALVMQKGYELHGRLVRPAMVVVCK